MLTKFELISSFLEQYVVRTKNVCANIGDELFFNKLTPLSFWNIQR